MPPTPATSSPGALPRAVALLESHVALGSPRGAQLCVWQGDRCVLDAAFGEARAQVPMYPDTLTLWLSSGKPLLAVAIARHVEAGVIDLDDPVAEFVPAFAEKGKEAITVRHLLTHTGGIRSVVFDYPRQTWDESIRAVCGTRLETGWELGVTAGYHPHSGWNILGRLLEVCSGRPLGEHLREAVLLPCGMNDSWVGVPPEPPAIYDALEPKLSCLQNTTEATPDPGTRHGRAWVTGCAPGGNSRGPARDLARFYRCLLGGGTLDGVTILQPHTVAEFTGRQRRDTYDRTFRAVMDWGLGFMVNNQRHDEVNRADHGHETCTPYSFGPHASDASFGHGGNQSSIGFADPEHALAVAVVFNDMPGEAVHQKRMHDLLGAVYDDLGLMRHSL